MSNISTKRTSRCVCLAPVNDYCNWCKKMICDQCNVSDKDESPRCVECHKRTERAYALIEDELPKLASGTSVVDHSVF